MDKNDRNEDFIEDLDKQPEGPPITKKKRGRYWFYLLICFIALLLIIYLASLVYMWIEDRENQAEEVISTEDASGRDPNIAEDDPSEDGESLPDVYTQEELDLLILAAQEEEAERILGGIRSMLEEGQTMVETLRPFYKDEIVVVSGNRFHFVPIHPGLMKNNLQQENLQILENRELQYMDGGTVVSHKGIDVSHHQGNIDWETVKQTDVEFVFIRVGYRGYGSGRMMEDDQFENNIKGALSAGLKVGVYYFSQAINVEEALEEARFTLEQIAPYKVEMPVVIDIERVADSQGRANLISVEERTNVATAFCEAIEAAGYIPMIYHNMEMGALMLDLEPLEKYEKWFAYYGTTLYYPYDYQIWQYTEKGSLPGIEGDVDLNISFKMWGD